MPQMGMDLKLVQLIAYTDWNETYEKQPDGTWTNYSYEWMFKPGAMKRLPLMQMELDRITIC